MLFEAIKQDLTVFLIATLPIIELRGAIPYGIGILKMPFIETFIWAFLGNIFPVFFILKLLNPAILLLFRHSIFLKKHTELYFEKLHKKHSQKFNELGTIFLAIFVAIPIPGTGAWTGALLAYLFNMPFWLAFFSIALGVAGAGIIVTFFSEFAIIVSSLI